MRRKDLSGQTFGKLTVVGIGERGSHARRPWICKCECGASTVAFSADLLNGRMQSCGCFRKKNARAQKLTHGQAHTQIYWVWRGMIARCTDKKHIGYAKYGGRGIEVCERWKASFENFIADMGERPTDQHSIERKNNNGNYCPENCCWATRHEQARNTSQMVVIEFNGRRMILSDWAAEIGCTISTLKKRLKSWPLELALTLKPSLSRKVQHRLRKNLEIPDK